MKKTFLAYVLLAQAAFAHSGHEAAVISGDAHWLTEPDHLVVIVLAAVLAGLGLRRLFRRKPNSSARETRS